MAERPSQQKDRAVPQLSCALCRDRKLKCDKLDPCTNCTSSGVVCVPVYRPRLPRGRHARRARNNTSPSATTPPTTATRRRNTQTVDPSIKPTSAAAALSDNGIDGNVLGSRIDRLESLVQAGDSSRTNSNLESSGLGDFDLSHRVRRLESLVKEFGSGSSNQASATQDCQDCHESGRRRSAWANRSRSGTDQLPSCTLAPSIEDSDDALAAATSFPSPTSWKPELSVGSDQDDGLCMRSNDHFWNDLIHGNHGHEHNGVLPFAEQHDQDIEMDELSQDEPVGSDLCCLSLLGLNNSSTVSPLTFPRDKAQIGQLCRVYLQNVDPIIKILHRPSVSRWMLEGDRYLGYPEEHTSVMALESAICYAAANTLTDTQCMAMFQMSKTNIVSTHRKLCESAIERAGLLTTRDRIVLQAFVLYLIGRRSEEKGTAVWTLVALAVRLTMAMGLNQEPNEGVKSSEIFFHRQMRLRLWLTICLLDLQASFAQSTKPLISHIDAEAAVSQVRHLNDYDFDLSTTEDIPDREELTETTFALVTYRAQVAGRLLNFAAPEPSSSGTSGTSSPSIAALPSRKQRRHYVSQFQQQALVLLHFCDPESSSYAWFTWHSTQCLVSAMRLSELLPFQYTPGTQTPATPPSPRSRSDTDLLRRTLQNLEKAQLMYSDPRGERFRWYITIPWLALSTAIAECNICPDTDLVRRAWPVIEASYEQYESFFLKNSGDDFQSPLAVLMNQTRERLSSTLQGTFRPGYSPCGERGNDSVNKSLGQPLPTPNSRGSVTTPVDPVLTAGSSIPNGSSSGSEASYIMSTQLFPQHGWDPNSLSLEYTPGIGGSMTTPNLYHSLSSSELFEPSWIGGDVLTVYSNLETEDTSLVTSGDRQHRDLYEISNHTRI